MFWARPPVAALLIAAILSGCGAPAPPASDAAAGPPADSAYTQSPRVTGAQFAAASVTLSGQASPGARVRLGPPEGEARYAQADGEGKWALALPVMAEPRIFGLSATAEGRQLQSEGYLILTPSGKAAVLRAGAGALRLDPQPAASIGAFDFDQQGGAVVSGRAPAGATVMLRLDGFQVAEGRADAGGRFSISLTSPITAGPHRLEMLGDGFSARVSVDASRAAALEGGPFRSVAMAGGVRADWQTPGGGVQSTLILG